MPAPALPLILLPDDLAVCRLPPDTPLPAWVAGSGFVSITRTVDELSIVVARGCVPAGVTMVAGWRALKVRGPLDFGLTGILAALATPLADAGISLFAIATYDTDYVLVRQDVLDRAVMVLTAAGHHLVG